ncbi:MAG: hypothetical protein RI897_4513 [Verrucomicrobiota bacterium]
MGVVSGEGGGGRVGVKRPSKEGSMARMRSVRGGCVAKRLDQLEVRLLAKKR